MKQLTLNGLEDSIAPCEALGLANVLIAYAENASGETIESIGFNPNSGYVYIALENGVSICSMLGQSVEYLVTNPYDGEEVFFDSYAEAMAYDWEEEEEEEDLED